MAQYLSFLEQTLHYFDRPHTDVLTKPLDSPAAWRGDQVRTSDEWRYVLSADEIGEIESAIETSKANGKPLAEQTASDFPLPVLANKFDAWRDELTDGRGFQVISGVPVLQWGREDSERFFWCFGLHLGRPG
ncbi:MAG: hypothetical protein MI923_00935, partial [Phycisphaerales bacterium]|nr:hypothetical protein [Phycisphaerales bacterium]